MDTTEADSKMSLWGEFDVAEEPSKANDAPSPYIHQFSNVQPKSTSLNTSEKVKTLSTECNSKEDFFTHLLRLVWLRQRGPLLLHAVSVIRDN